MPRLLLQTDDRRILLEERDIGLAELDDEGAGRRLLTRLGRAIRTAEQRPRPRPVRRLLMFVPAAEDHERAGRAACGDGRPAGS